MAFIILIINILANYFPQNLRIKEEIFFTDTLTKIKLRHQFLFVRSDTLYFFDSVLSREFYEIDYEEGEVRFRKYLPCSLPCYLVYYSLPLKENISPPPKILRKVVKVDTNPQDSLPSDYQKEESNNDDLMIGGSKSLAAVYNDELGFSIEQSTNLSLRGKVGNAEIEGYLSDKSFPDVQGVSLKELENIYLRVRAGNTSLLFGDYNRGLEFKKFGHLNRRGVGISLSHTFFEGDTITALYQTSRSKFGFNLFYGQDFKQGPYYLTVAGQRVAIVPHSEEVYIDGQLLSRGFLADYTIDYELGRITFTNRQIITKQKKIEVYFLYRQEQYEKHSYGVSATTAQLPFITKFIHFSEADDKDNNLQYFLSEEDKNYLSTIGNDTSKAWLAGEKYVGRNRGDYQKRGDTLIYVGEGQGDYIVNFTFVGESLGDYNYDNTLNAYRYVGAKKGNYLSKFKISLPQKQSLYLLGFTYPLAQRIVLNLDGLLSDNDLNLYSKKDDGNRFGYGYNLDLALKHQLLNLNLYRKEFFKNYYFADDPQIRNFYGHWQEEDFRAVKSLSGAKMLLALQKFFSNELGVEFLDGKTKSKKRFYQKSKFFWANYHYETGTAFSRHQLALSPQYRFLAPELLTALEITALNRLFTFAPKIAVQFERPPIFLPAKVWLAFENIREDEKYNQFFNKKSETNIFKTGGLFRNPILQNTEVNFGTLRKNYFIANGENLKSFFADLNFNLTVNDWLLTNVEYSLSNQVKEKLEIKYIKVGKNKGNYSKDTITNEYYPDPKGDYIRVSFPIGQPIPVIKNQAQGSIKVIPSQNFDFSILVNFERSSQRSKRPEIKLFYDLQTGWLFKEDLNFSFRKEYNLTSKIDFDLEELEERGDKNYFTIKKSFNESWDLSGILQYALSKREKRGIFAWRGREIIFYLNPFLKKTYHLSLKPGYGHLIRFYLQPNYQTFLIRKGILEISKETQFLKDISLMISLNLIYRWYKDREDVPFDLSLNEPKGLNYSLSISGSKNITNNFVLNLDYLLSKEEVRGLDQNLSFGARIYF